MTVETPSAQIDLLLQLLDGARFANAIMPWGKSGPIALPDQPEDRALLIEAHLLGAGAVIDYAPANQPPRRMRLDVVTLAAFNPGHDGCCRWLAIDLDGADHGQDGLQNPALAVKCVAEQVFKSGLGDGLIVARSRRGVGRHILLFLPQPVSLPDAVIAIAVLIAGAIQIAEQEHDGHGGQHAFLCVDSLIACPGQAGSVELNPQSTKKPDLGWPIALPLAGSFATCGGGVIVDPFDDNPKPPSPTTTVDADNWQKFLAYAKEQHAGIKKPSARRPLNVQDFTRNCDLNRALNPQTRQFLDGRTPEGARNQSCFASSGTWRISFFHCSLPERRRPGGRSRDRLQR